MKRNLFIIIIVFIGIIVVMFLSDIITIGEKFSKITNLWYAEYVFYIILLVPFSYFIIFPIWKVHRAPKLPGLNCEGELDIADLKLLGRNLSNNCNHISDNNVRKQHSRELLAEINEWYAKNDVDNLKKVISDEIKIRFDGDKRLEIKGISNLVKEYAATVFMVTAVSPSSKVDAFSTIVLNFTMMKSLIIAAGFRPTNAQLWKMYLRILITSLLSYSVSEALNNAGGIRPFKFVEDIDFDGTTQDLEVDVDGDADSFSFVKIISNLKIPASIVRPVLDGVTNALMTLRIGYVTCAYLKDGQDLFFDKKKCSKAKREALKESLKSLPSVLALGSKNMGKKVKTILSLCGFKVQSIDDNAANK